MIKSYLNILRQSPHPLQDIIAYFQGNYRYSLYYSPYFFLKELLRPHIREQITFRIATMNRECYNQGTCVLCGCNTPHLQMASKQCDGKEYPPMMSKSDWKAFKNEKLYKDWVSFYEESLK